MGGWYCGDKGQNGNNTLSLDPDKQCVRSQVQCLNGWNAYFWNFMAKCYHFSFFCSYKVVLENFFYCLVSEFSQKRHLINKNG